MAILCLKDNKTAGPDNIPAWQHSDKIRSTDGVVIKNKELNVARWAEYQGNLLNKVHISYTGLLGDLPTFPIIPKLCDPPTLDEEEKAILCLNDNKAACPDNIPAWQHSDNIRSTDGVLIKNKELILARWAEYLQNLLNKVHITDPAFLLIYRKCRSSQNLMIHHHLTKWKWPFSNSHTTKQPFLTTSTPNNIMTTSNVLLTF